MERDTCEHFAADDQQIEARPAMSALHSVSTRITTALGLLTILLLVTTLSLEAKSRTLHTFLLQSAPSIETPDIDCGSTPSSAVSAGCRFDPMSFSWLPPSCYDAKLIASFLAIKPWQWYLNSSDAQPVPFEMVQQGIHDYLWVTREFHLFHCTYQWRKMHRAVLQGKPLDTYVGNYSHTEHCEYVLTKEVLELGMEVVDVQIQRKFVSCGRLNEQEKQLYRTISG